MDVRAGQAVITRRGEWIRHTPEPDRANISRCASAFTGYGPSRRRRFSSGDRPGKELVSFDADRGAVLLAQRLGPWRRFKGRHRAARAKSPRVPPGGNGKRSSVVNKTPHCRVQCLPAPVGWLP
jgi:hypothetical protein